MTVGSCGVLLVVFLVTSALFSVLAVLTHTPAHSVQALSFPRVFAVTCPFLSS